MILAGKFPLYIQYVICQKTKLYWRAQPKGSLKSKDVRIDLLTLWFFIRWRRPNDTKGLRIEWSRTTPVETTPVYSRYLGVVLEWPKPRKSHSADSHATFIVPKKPRKERPEPDYCERNLKGQKQATLTTGRSRVKNKIRIKYVLWCVCLAWCFFWLGGFEPRLPEIFRAFSRITSQKPQFA